jgi:hypothetical protein
VHHLAVTDVDADVTVVWPHHIAGHQIVPSDRGEYPGAAHLLSLMRQGHPDSRMGGGDQTRAVPPVRPGSAEHVRIANLCQGEVSHPVSGGRGCGVGGLRGVAHRGRCRWRPGSPLRRPGVGPGLWRAGLLRASACRHDRRQGGQVYRYRWLWWWRGGRRWCLWRWGRWRGEQCAGGGHDSGEQCAGRDSLQGRPGGSRAHHAARDGSRCGAGHGAPAPRWTPDGYAYRDSLCTSASGLGTVWPGCNRDRRPGRSLCRP